MLQKREQALIGLNNLPQQPLPYGRLLVGLLLGSLALGWGAYQVNWPATFSSLTGASPLWVAGALACSGGVSVAKAVRWRILYGPAVPPFRPVFAALVTGQMLNFLLPIRAGELARLGMMSRAGQPAAVTLSTLLVEKTLDLIAAGLVSLLLVGLTLAPDWVQDSARAWLLLGLSLVAGLASVWLLRRGLLAGLGRALAWLPLPARQRRRLLVAVESLVGAIGALTKRRTIAGSVLWTVIIWLLSPLTIWALLLAFELHLPPAAPVLMMLTVLFSNVIPSPPALLGLVPGLSVAVLGYFQVTQAAALSFGLALNAVIVGPVILLGLGAMWDSAHPVIEARPGRRRQKELEYDAN
jgi:uncharacterized protein (TIRG00374 family)